jgi:RimJ/RimL family protein N-acetyltransferase
LHHEIVAEGHAFRLRPAGFGDSAFILSLRTDPALSRFLHPVSGRLEDQQAWFREYQQRAGDWYWIIEQLDGTPEGTIGLYGLEADPAHAEWGRWILKPGSLAAVESVLLMYGVAFSRLGLEWVFCRTLAENRQVVSFHDNCGLVRQGLQEGAFTLGGRPVDAVVHRVSREAWAGLQPILDQKALRLARLLEGQSD